MSAPGVCWIVRGCDVLGRLTVPGISGTAEIVLLDLSLETWPADTEFARRRGAVPFVSLERERDNALLVLIKSKAIGWNLYGETVAPTHRSRRAGPTGVQIIYRGGQTATIMRQREIIHSPTGEGLHRRVGGRLPRNSEHRRLWCSANDVGEDLARVLTDKVEVEDNQINFLRERATASRLVKHALEIWRSRHQLIVLRRCAVDRNAVGRSKAVAQLTPSHKWA